jgi:alpha-1,3-glucosyltransferase
VYPACIGLHLLELAVTPPAHLPDIFSVLNVLVCTPVFVLTWLWSIKRGLEIQWALGGLRSRADKATDGSRLAAASVSAPM